LHPAADEARERFPISLVEFPNSRSSPVRGDRPMSEKKKPAFATEAALCASFIAAIDDRDWTPYPECWLGHPAGPQG
jgi:hypothetical protein